MIDEYRKYSFELTEDNLLSTIKDAMNSGYSAMVVINGMYYTIKLNEQED